MSELSEKAYENLLDSVEHRRKQGVLLRAEQKKSGSGYVGLYEKSILEWDKIILGNVRTLASVLESVDLSDCSIFSE
jgi:hypothetical protein